VGWTDLSPDFRARPARPGLPKAFIAAALCPTRAARPLPPRVVSARVAAGLFPLVFVGAHETGQDVSVGFPVMDELIDTGN
jgi:hypothetical protein